MLAQQRLVRLEELERLQLVAALLEPLHDVADQATLHPVRLNHDVRALHLHRGRSGARRGVAQRRGADTERHAELGESEHGQGSSSKEKKKQKSRGSGWCAGCLWDRESDVLCPPCVCFHNIEG